MNTDGVVRIGWIGTGVMGAAMCAHLLDAGHALTVYTRTRARAEALLAAGASWADSPAAAAADADVVFTMVGTPVDVREVILGQAGVLAGLARGSAVIDMTTSEPALAREVYEAARERGVESLDAPVSGGDVGARNASLSIMIGGDETAVLRLQPLLELLGKTIVHQGPAGSGQHAKMVNQILVAAGTIGVCEALLYAHRSGLDPVVVLKSVSGGAAGSWSLSNLAPRILDGDFAPGFMVEHFLKDMEIALAEARRMNLALPGLALVHELYLALRAQGGGRDGTHALIRALASLSAIDWPPER